MHKEELNQAQEPKRDQEEALHTDHLRIKQYLNSVQLVQRGR